MKELKENSILINPTISVSWPQLEGKTELINLTNVHTKFNGAYCTNNSTIAFVTDEGVYVTPYTEPNMRKLIKNGFTHELFYVPFSNGDYPTYEKAKWVRLRRAAEETYCLEYEMDCAKWCDSHDIEPLLDERMENCYRIPRDGVAVRQFDYETRYYPICDEPYLNYRTVHKLGQFSSNNGKVVFTYRDGHTYVAKGYSIIRDLIANGYKEAALFVPFSNGEVIIDREEKIKWDNVTKE